MWILQISTFKKGPNGTHAKISTSEPQKFENRKDAEEFMYNYVESNTDDALKFLGFLDAPWGMHDTLDPTSRFWMDFHLAI